MLMAPAFGKALAAVAVVLFWAGAERGESVVLGLRRPWILVVLTGAAWLAAFSRLDARVAPTVAIAAQAMCRAGAIGLAWVLRPAASGFHLSERLSTATAVAALAQGIAASFLAGIRGGLLLIAAAYLLLRIWHDWCNKRRGGLDGGGFVIARDAVQVLIAVVLAFLF
jgi:hypothetical protein